MRRTLATLGLTLVSALLSGCWVQQGWDAGRGNWNASESTITSGNVGQLVQAWDTAIPEASYLNLPVSANGAVYVTAGSTRVAALDAADGTIRWTRDITVEQPELVADLDTPLWSKGSLLVPANVFNHGSLFTLDTSDGSIISGGSYGTRSIGSLAMKDDVLAAAGGEVHPGIGLAEITWKYKPMRVFTFPGSSPGAYAIVGERIMWSFGSDALGFSAACPPYEPPFPPGGCAADWSTPLGAIPAGPAAIGDDQVVYPDSSGTVTVLDTATGAVLWTAEAGAPITKRAAVAGNSILVATDDGRLVAFPAAGCGAATCTALWEGTVGAAAATQPVAAGDVVYAIAGTEIRAFAVGGCGAVTCAPLATLGADSGISGAIVDDGRLIATTTGGHVTAWALPDA